MDLIFKHFLNFKDSIGFIEIAEPLGFDQLNFTLEREGNEDGRNIFFIDKELRLTFLQNFFNFTNVSLLLPSGETTDYLTHGFDYLVGELKRKGWESRIEYLVRWENQAFIFGELDGFTSEIFEDKVIVSVIQDTNLETLKRNNSTYINAFSDKKLVNGEYIQPCKTHNVLLKSKPKLNQSSFDGLDPTTHTFNGFSASPISGGGGVAYYFFNKKITRFDIDDTLINSVPFQEFQNFVPAGGTLLTVRKEACLVRFLQRAENITVKIKGLNTVFKNLGSADLPSVTIQLRYGVFYEDPWTVGAGSSINILPATFMATGNVVAKSGDFTFNIPAVNAGETIDLYCFVKDWSTGNGSQLTCQVESFVSIQSIDIIVNSVGVDIVAPMVRLIDLAKHNIKSACDLPIFSDHFDVGGEHYDNFCFNGNMITGATTFKFNNTPENIIKAINIETRSGFQFLPNKIDHLKHKQFYEDVQIAEFLETQNYSNSDNYNKKYLINTVNFKYDKSSSGRNANDKGTLDDVHTEAQFKFPSNKKDGNLNLECKHIRSVYLIEEQKNKVIKDQTADENDESLFIIDCVKAKGNESNSIFRNFQCTGISIYSDGSFIWTNLGIKVGQTIQLNGVPVQILSITQNILNTSFIFPAGGYYPLNITYSYGNSIDYVIRTKEDFDTINGVNNPDRYGNLRYSIKRNLKNYFPIFATANLHESKTVPYRDIKNTDFKVNDKLETRLNFENNLTIDKADIKNDDIKDLAILSTKIINATVFADFEKVKKLLEDVRTIRGYILIRNLKGEVKKGYLNKLNYHPKTGKLKLELEEKYNKYALNITSLHFGSILINKKLYDNVSYSVNNNYVSLFIENSINILEPTHFEIISINNTFYYDINTFLIKLNTII